MKVILSRKGFDSSYGGFPSIILPDGKMISFPIPEKKYRNNIKEQIIKYHFTEDELKNILDLFGKRKIKMPSAPQGLEPKDCIFHLDPSIQNMDITMTYIDEENKKNKIQLNLNEKKIGALGQSGAAAGHLVNNKISPSDLTKEEPALFLFFGLFQETNKELEPIKKPFHAIWGYLISYAAIDISNNPLIPVELKSHPHFINRKTYEKRNIIFYGDTCGTFKFDVNHKEYLQLTKKGSDNLTNWKIQNLWKKMDSKDKITMTYNDKKIKSQLDLDSECDEIEFTAASIGQEFIIKNANPQELKKWLKNLGLPQNARNELGI